MSKHRWAKPHRPDLNHTYRTCEKCGVIRVTRHEPGNFPKEHWSEWERDGKSLPAKPAPKCIVAA